MRCLRLTISTATVTTGANNQVVRVGVTITYQWFTNAKWSFHSRDNITVNWDGSVFGRSGFNARDYVTSIAGEVFVREQTAPMEAIQGGLGYFAFTPMTFHGVPAGFWRGIATFNLIPQGLPMFWGGNNPPQSTDINVRYVHNNNPLPFLGFGFSVSGVTVNVNTALLWRARTATMQYWFRR